MFNWFRRTEETVTQFEDNESAFAHACSLRYPLLLNARIPALVIEEGRRGSEGEHWYLLHLAGPNGILETWGCTMAGAPAYPSVGDLVGFHIVRIASELPEEASLIGYIACRLEPVVVGGRKWRIGDTFTPPNLKPEIHL
jgi:hypothetical protein